MVACDNIVAFACCVVNLEFTTMISLDTLQRDIGLPHWEDVAALGVRQRGTTLREWVRQKATTLREWVRQKATTLREWVGQRATTLREWVRQEVTALAKLAAPVVSCLAMFPASSPLFHPIMYLYLSHIVQPKSWGGGNGFWRC